MNTRENRFIVSPHAAKPADLVEGGHQLIALRDHELRGGLDVGAIVERFGR
jgi:hypothetical protein